MKIKEYDIDLDNVDIDGICAAQQKVGSGNLTINGALASLGVVTLDFARQLGIASTGNLSGVTFTVYGTDPDGNSINEAITGPNNTTVETTAYFKTVTRVAVSGSVATDVTVGTVDEASTHTIVLNAYDEVATTISVDVTGTINFTVQETYDHVLANGSASTNWVNITALATKTADTTATSGRGATAIRLLVNSYTDTAELQMTVIPAHHG